MPDKAPIRAQPATIASAVSLKLLDLWTSDPELWFAQAEALFTALKYQPREDEVWSSGSRSPCPICLRSTRHYSVTARSSLHSTENQIGKPFLPFKTTTLTAASARGRPWGSKAITTFTAYVEASRRYSHRCCQ